jgi:hypothetical protein
MATSALAARALAGAAAVLFVVGCGSLRVSVPVKPPPGAIFEHFSAPVETNFEGTSLGAKRGKATVHFIYDPILTGLPLATWGDASIDEAAANGGLSKTHFVDYELLSVLGIYVQVTTKVSGD